LLAVLDILADTGTDFLKHGSVARVSAACNPIPHPVKTVQVDFQVFEYSGAVSQDIYFISTWVEGGKERRSRLQLTISCKHRILFLQYKCHVVHCMAGCMGGYQRCPFYAKYLSILDIGLSLIRLMLEDLCLGANPE
jgi:hypothetical protein